MAKILYRKSGRFFIENGDSELELAPVEYLPDWTRQDRIIRTFDVIKIIDTRPDNPIKVGNRLALSFDKQNVNKKEYRWKPGEEFQVPLAIYSKQDLQNEKDAKIPKHLL